MLSTSKLITPSVLNTSTIKLWRENTFFFYPWSDVLHSFHIEYINVIVGAAMFLIS